MVLPAARLEPIPGFTGVIQNLFLREVLISSEGKQGMWRCGQCREEPCHFQRVLSNCFRILFAGVFMVYGESGKLDDNVFTPRVQKPPQEG